MTTEDRSEIGTGSEGEPYLSYKNTSRYWPAWRSLGCPDAKGLTIYSPQPEDPEYFIISFYALAEFWGQPTGSSTTVKAFNDPDGLLLKPPRDWRLMWSVGNNGKGSFWEAVPPDGYVALGWVAQEDGYKQAPQKPKIPNYRCVHEDWVEFTKIDQKIWDDKHTHVSNDLSLFSIVGLPNAFVGQPDHKDYVGTVHKLINLRRAPHSAA